MNRKVIIIAAGLVIVGISGFSVWWQWGGGQAILEPTKVEQKPQASPEEKIETLDWEDPAGFWFAYNKAFKIDTNPGDEVSYANLDLRLEGKKGNIKIVVNDSKYKDLEEWLARDETVKKGSALDTTLAGVPAKKVALKDGVLMTGFIDSDNVFYVVTLQPGEDGDFWRKNYEAILTSFKFIPLEGEETDSSRLQPATAQGESGEEGAIVEEEETIE